MLTDIHVKEKERLKFEGSFFSNRLQKPKNQNKFLASLSKEGSHPFLLFSFR